jgi:tellurium resistance protein TerD
MTNMGKHLVRGGNTVLGRQASVSPTRVVFGWSELTSSGTRVAIDSYIVLVGTNGHALEGWAAKTSDFTTADAAPLSGTETDDACVLTVDLSKIPKEADRVVFALAIRDAHAQEQNFGDVPHVQIRLENAVTSDPITYYDYQQETTDTAVVLAEIYRHNLEWKARAVGQGFFQGLTGLSREFEIAF